ncbi:MAG: hypothetical protein KA784_00010 [Aquabacterium sp.]|nr:hypothetical protein [Aquabacterium sp.]
MAKLLTDEEVFGTAGSGLLTDEQVFGKPEKKKDDKKDGGRSIAEITTDLGASALGGLVGIAKLPAMGIDKAVTGDWIGPGTTALGEFGDAVDMQKSQYLRDKEQASQQRVADFGKSITDVVGTSGALPTTARIVGEFGAGAWEAVKDPALLTSALAQQGPMLGASRLAGLGTDAAVRGVASRAPELASTALGRAAVANAGTAGAVVGGAGLQAADIGSETHQRLMGLSDAQWANVPGFSELAAQIGVDGAKQKMASAKAFVAAAQAGAASVLSSMLPGGRETEKAIMGRAGGTSPVRAVGSAVVGEARQEGIEEGYGRLAGNEAVRQVNPLQDLSEGVGGAAGQGAALGGLMGGATTAGGLGLQRYQDYRAGRAPKAAPPPAAESGDSTPVPAADLLGTVEAPPPAAPAAPTEAEKSLMAPRALTTLDRVDEIDKELSASAPDAPGVAALQAERTALTKDWPLVVPGLDSSFSTEAGARVEARYSLVDADSLLTSHDESLRQNPAYPQELQPRERDRAASAAQISGIVQKLDPARLGLSPDAANGAPIIGADGLVESGNARTIALKRIYQANGQKAEDYKTFLRDNAAQFGLTPEAIDGMAKPVLVRVRTTPVNRAEFARQANASTVAQMSPSEQARSDSARIDSMEDLRPDDSGEFSTSRDFIKRFMARLPITEQSGMIDATGRLSSTGYARVRNAVLAKAYGDSPVLVRMVESMDDNARNITKALMIAAPRVAQARQAIGEGARFDADLTPHLVEAAQEIGRLKDAGTSVADALAQIGLMGETYAPETATMLQFLSDNARRPRRIADFIAAYYDALDAVGDPRQDSMFGAPEAPAKGDLMAAARRTTEAANDQAPTQNPRGGLAGENQTIGGPDAAQPANAPGDRGGNQGDGPAGTGEWKQFGPESGTLGIPRDEMPQIKGAHRGALINFLEARGIGHESDEVPAKTLKPTQAEYSQAKVDKFAESGAVGDRSVLVSSDGHVLDGHHQWVGQAERGEKIPVIRLDAPIRQLLDVVNEFPSAGREEGATAARDAVRAEFTNALGDLAQIASKFSRAAMVPEATPDLMPTLVRLFKAGIQEVGYGMKDLLAYVKAAVKADPRLKTFWNKIGNDLYQKAARQAIDAAESAPQERASFANEKDLSKIVNAIDLSATPEEKVAQLVALTNENVPIVKALIARIDAAFGTKSGDNRKEPEKILSKSTRPSILAKKPWHGVEHIRDSYRFKTVLKSVTQLPAVIKMLEDAGIEIVKRDVDKLLTPLDWGWRIVAFDLRMPNGQLVEFYLPINEMERAKKDGGHHLFEEWRNEDPAKLSPEQLTAMNATMQRSRDLYQAAWDAYLARTGDTEDAIRAALTKAADTSGGASLYPSSDKSPIVTDGAGDFQAPRESRTAEKPSAYTKAAGEPSTSTQADADLLIATSPFGNSVPSLSENIQSVNTGISQNGTAPNNRVGAQAQGPGAARKAAGGGQAAGVRGRAGQPDLFGDGQPDAGAAPAREVGQRPGNPGGQPEPGPGAKPRGGAGQRAGVPAGRDIAPKSGLNYRFGPDDLTYAGSWQKKAAANIDAVELLKKLQAEGRQAARDEQKVLAQFIGWGAGELANSLFGKKLDASAKALDAYNLAKGVFTDGVDRLDRFHRSYWSVAKTLQDMGKLRFGDSIAKSDITLAKFGLEPADVRWVELRDRLKAALTPEEWAEASRSTQYAHYTSKPIVSSMWRALERFGFKGGVMLEPGAGNGVFPGLMPEAMSNNSSYTGIEFDAITGGILKQLQPDERILVESFIDSKLPKGFYDAAIGNPPFSQTKILMDPEYKKHAFSLHDYFFAKTMDRVKPGGLVMFVTSRYTMDKLNDKARAYLAERADLVGAIRLPQTAFKQNAGTDVVTDVLFLRKKVAGETFEHAQPWGKSVPMKVGGQEFPVNEYFHAHPEMVLGAHSDTGKMQNSPDPQYTVLPPSGDIEALFDAAVENMPANIYKAERGSAAEAAKVREIDWNPKAQKEGNYYVTAAGVLMQREGGVGTRVDRFREKQAAIVKAIVPLRDALKQAHYDQLNDGPWEASLAALQAAYKKFTAVHGLVNQFTSKTVHVKVDELDEDGNPTGVKVADEEERRVFPILKMMEDDPDWTLLAALETVNDDTGAIKPGPFLSARVLGKPPVAKIDTPHDAMLSVLNDLGRVDTAVIAERIGMSEKDAIASLGESIFKDPERGWVTSDEYLSGNVKAKLQDARAAARADRSFERNVTALEGAQPAPKSLSQINIGFGMNWIPGEIYSQFLRDTAGVVASVKYNEATRQWAVVETAGGSTLKATADWGTGDRNITALVEHALTGRPILIKRTVGSGATKTTVTDTAAIEAANEKLNALKEEFSTWVWRDGDRSDRLVQVFNDKFNTTVPRAYDGRHLTMPGASKLFNIFDHVKRGAWRIIQSGNTYLAHAVGSGKTFQMVISAMEQKRLGFIKKPMMVVPNHMLQQFAREWQELYPAARLMVADENNFHTDNRRRFVSRVAMSDLDGVIITHSAFKLLDLDPAFKQKVIDEQLAYMRAALDEAGGDSSKTVEERKKQKGPKPPTVKQIERQIENLEQKLAAALDGAGKDTNIRFDELGVDQIYVDEAHAYRKLDFATTRQVKGLSPDGSAQALDLFIKARYLEEKNPGRSLVMASGTPVTNTLAELYTVSRFMGRAAMAERGIEDFDSWAAMFGRERTELEPNAAGKYEPVTRFSKFVNVPELTQMFREFADVVTADQLAAMLGDKRPKVEGGSRSIIVTPKSPMYAGYQKVLEQRVQTSRKWKPSKEEPNNPDPIIKIIGDGRLAAIDMRFIAPSSPNIPTSKLNVMIDDVISAFKSSAGAEYLGKDGQVDPNKGSTMMVFSDLGFGAGVAASRGFSARAWFEKRLRDAGVPMGQVAFMSDYKKSTEKLKLFRDMNAGRVRLLIGSSKNMGTGVNAQQRLLNLFHLDSPWFPADLEQREGRIVRQGNKNPLVNLRAYAAKGTYDENMWKMLASKQFFIDQALNGDENLREVEDLDSQSAYNLASAMVADDPRVMQLAGIKAEIKKLQRLYQAHEQQRQGFRTAYRWARTTIDHNQTALVAADALASKVTDLSGDKFTAKIGKATFTDRAEWGGALLAKYLDLLGHAAESQVIGEISGFPIKFVGLQGAGSYSATVQLLTAEPVLLVRDGQESEMGLAMRATNAVVDVARAPARMREIIAASRAKMDSLAPRLETPFPMAEMLANKIAEAIVLEAEIEKGPAVDAAPVDDTAWGDQATNNEAANEADVVLSRGPGRGMEVSALSGVAKRIAAALPGLPKVHVLRSPAEAPAALAEFIRSRGAMADAEGAFHEGEIYLFSSGIADELRAEHVLAEHEAGHAGLSALLGEGKANVMRSIANQNASVRKAATTLQAGGMSLVEAVEEVLVDMPSASLAKLAGWRKVVDKVRGWLAAHGFERMAGQLDRWIESSMSEQARADLFVADLVRAARASAGKNPTVSRNVGSAPALSTGKLVDDLAEQEKWLNSEARARGFTDIEDLLANDYQVFEKLATLWRERHPADALLSRAGVMPGAAAAPAGTPKLTAEQRAEALIMKSWATPQPVDKAAQFLTRITGVQRVTSTVYGKTGQLLDRLVPERIKAGLVSDYGVPEAVIDQRAALAGRQRQAMRGAGALLEKLATLTRAESRVAYGWMNMDGADPSAYVSMMQGLPEESVRVLQDVQKLIDTLSQEAVRLGQLDAETFKRHRFAYLRRSYFKHAAELQKGDVAKRARAISILGDQYKGRGMTEAVPMAKIQNGAPEWWQRKLVAGKADTSLKGEKFVRLERRAASGERTKPLDGMEGKARGRLMEVVYFPAGEIMPARYADWTQAGTWDAVNTKGGDVVMWRDFTKDEREKMGEIDEARYAIAKTLHAMIHDVEVGKYLEWLSRDQAQAVPPEGFTVVQAGERLDKEGRTRQDPFATYTAAEWVKVPDTKIQGTSVSRYGKLAGLYVPGPVWNDVRQVSGGGVRIGGETWNRILSLWKASKTALSPAVHTNNIMSNAVMADWHDVTAGHVAKALRIIMGGMERDGKGLIGRAGNVATHIGMADREAAKAVVARYQDSGGSIGSWVTAELAKEQLDPIVALLEAEVNGAAAATDVGVYSALQHLLHRRFGSAFEALKASKPGKATTTEAQNLLNLYSSEDDVFRLAAWLKAKEDGLSDFDAGKIARRSFLDYSINAPWIQAMRSTALPFISFTYRAVPMLLETMAKKPHKMFKLMALAGALNYLGVLLAGGGDDKERKLLPEEKAGGVWGLVPKLIRMPWNDAHGSPVYLDVRRWIPAGDVFDLGQGHSAVPIPPSLMPGGPLALIGELVLNKTAFTGQAITLDTDTATEKAGKVADYLWKAFMPNLMGVPGTYATTGVADALKGRTDKFGREMSPVQALASGFGVKLGSYPADVLRNNLRGKAQGEIMEIEKTIHQLERQAQTKRISQEEFQAEEQKQEAKEVKIRRELAEKLN